jgi:hypothetical protein
MPLSSPSAAHPHDEIISLDDDDNTVLSCAGPESKKYHVREDHSCALISVLPDGILIG